MNELFLAFAFGYFIGYLHYGLYLLLEMRRDTRKRKSHAPRAEDGA